MRRKDREITDHKKIEEIIRDCHCCRLGFNGDDGAVYIVPLSFGYVCEDETDRLYFHSAKEGRKLDLIRKNSRVGFELDTNYQLNEAEIACGYSARFQSVIGTGTVRILTEPEEKRRGLQALMDHTAGPRAWEFSEEMLEAVCVFELTVESMACKEHV